jgi:hypothetical protein|tara:strand:- start:304 stop:495 length:192 start_codon:yes stop_codon:yes gene_type:complete
MSKRKYEVEIQIAQTKIYHVEAKDEEDLLNKEKSGDIENEGKLIRTNTSESMLGGWSFIENVK